MKRLKKRRRIQIIVATFLTLAAAAVLIGHAMKDGINYFRSPTQIVAAPPPEDEIFRIGGLVGMGTLIRGQGRTVTFAVNDGSASVPVIYTGILPDLFAEGQGMIGTGSYADGVFRATEILARHDETYMPEEIVEALKEQGVYREPDA